MKSKCQLQSTSRRETLHYSDAYFGANDALLCVVWFHREWGKMKNKKMPQSDSNEVIRVKALSKSVLVIKIIRSDSLWWRARSLSYARSFGNLWRRYKACAVMRARACYYRIPAAFACSFWRIILHSDAEEMIRSCGVATHNAIYKFNMRNAKNGK